MVLCVLSPVARQVLASISGSLVTLLIMCTWAFPSVALPQMVSPSSPINFTHQEASWFASLPFLMIIPGSVLGGLLCERVGPRRQMLVLSPALAACISLMTVGSWQYVQEAGLSTHILFLARILQCAVQALLFPVVSIYIYGVSDALRRGAMIGLNELLGATVYPCYYVAGCYLKWSTIAWLMTLVTFLPAFIGLLLSPESPVWLSKKGRVTDAYKVLSQLRCTEDETLQELNVMTQDLQTDKSCCQLRNICGSKSKLWAITLSTLILVLKELSGAAVLLTFMVSIFQKSEVGLTPCWSSVIGGVAQAICRMFSTFFIYRLPRKVVLVVGNVLIAVSTASLGTFFFLQRSGWDVNFLEWLPLASVVVFKLGFAGAVGSTSWVMATEVLPVSVRSLGISFGTSCYAATVVMVILLYNDGEPQIGLPGVFWGYAVGAVLNSMFIMKFCPETFGRTLSDIEEYWESFRRSS